MKLELIILCLRGHHQETIQKLQTQKNEEMKRWETIRDRAGKAEFSYYRVKSQAQRLKAEVSCLNENLKTYNCENVSILDLAISIFRKSCFLY